MTAELYVVTAYRGGNREKHSYVVGVYDALELAVIAGAKEKVYRAGKYECYISQHVLNQDLEDIDD